jgi:transcription initiation factor TFIIH subunit 2
MADSDEEYIAELSDGERDDDLGDDNDNDEDDAHIQVSSAGGRRAARAVAVGGKRRKQRRGGQEWEVARTWETLVEDADGTISATVGGILEAGKRKR